jgi:hypothetical protein
MSWEQRGVCRYYYQTRRDTEGRVVKMYCGRGVRALQAFRADLDSRARRQAQRLAQEQLNTLDHHTQALYQSVRTLARATYYSEGWYQHHRGEWRKRRITQEGENMGLPTPTTVQTLPSIENLQALIHQAQAGDAQSLPTIKHVLDHAPSLWQDAYSLSKRIENAWIRAIAGKDLLSQETLRRQVQALRLSLAEHASSDLEHLLIDMVCSTFLAYKQAELVAAHHIQRTGQTPTFHENHLSASQKRYVSAVRELGRMRQLLTPRPPTVLHIAR